MPDDAMPDNAMPDDAIEPVVDRLAARVRAAAPRLGAVRLVCVDGPAGSGKTTLASRLGAALGAQVLHADDFLEGWGGLAGMWPRLQAGVLDPLAAGRPGAYQSYDWKAEEFTTWHDVPVGDVLVLEGCGAARREVDDVAALRVWVEAPADVRLKRWIARDGEVVRPHLHAWLRDEAAHFAANSTRARADVVVDSGRWDPAPLVPARDWFAGDVLDVARGLLGSLLTTTSDEGRVTLRVTEVEAYRGTADPASHAFRGRSARNVTMFGEPGRLYVYRHLGIHACANVVCGPVGEASAVLLRAGEVTDGADLARRRRTRSGVVRADRDLARGPARLAVSLGIDLAWDGTDLADPGGTAVVHLPERSAGRAIKSGPRVGVNGPGADGDVFPWRLWLPGEPTVSVYRDARSRGAVRQTRPDTA